jgi:HEAT repeat protein
VIRLASPNRAVVLFASIWFLSLSAGGWAGSPVRSRAVDISSERSTTAGREKALIKSLLGFDPVERDAALDALRSVESESVIDQLISIVEKKDVTDTWRRVQAIGVLGALHPRKAIRPLFNVLRESHSGLPRFAAASLKNYSDSQDADVFIAMLDEQYPNIRSVAADVLGTMRSKQAVTKIIPLLNDEQPRLRAVAATALGRIADTSASAFLEKALFDKEPDVRNAAAWALGELRDRGAVDALIELTKVYQTREVAIVALGKIGEPEAITTLITLIQDKDMTYPEARAAEEALASFGALSVAPLIGTLRPSDVEKNRRNIACLVRIGEPAVASALVLSTSHDYLLRMYAAWIIQRVGPSAVPALAAASNDSDPEIRAYVAEFLGDIGDNRGLPTLVRLLEKDNNLTVRWKSIEAIGKMGVPLPEDELLRLVSSRDLFVRRSTAWVLAESRSPVPENVLAVLQKDDDLYIKKHVSRIVKENKLIPR